MSPLDAPSTATDSTDPVLPDTETKKLRFEDKAVPDTSSSAESISATSGQVGPKSGKLRQDSKKPRPSERLRHDSEPLPSGGTTTGGTDSHSGSASKKAAQDGKRMEKSKLRMEKSGEKLNAAQYQSWRDAHREIHQVEHENAGTEAAHRTELAGEHHVRGGTRFMKHRTRTRPALQVRKWGNRHISARADYAYRQLVQDNPGLQSNPVSRFWQKQQLKSRTKNRQRKLQNRAKKR